MVLSDEALEAKIAALEREKRERQAALDERTAQVEDLRVYKALLEELVRLKEARARQLTLRRRSQD